MRCVSLFSCAGLGDLGLRSAGFETIVSNELLKDRAEMMQLNFPETNVICGDIYEKKSEIVNTSLEILDGAELDLLIASPPCQSMSSNGKGRMSSSVKRGKREKIDPRSSLIIPAIEIIEELCPKAVIIENVSGMKDTFISNERGESELILEILYRRLPNYVFRSRLLNTADYGVPQVRKRLITVGIRCDMTDYQRVSNFFHVNDEFEFHPEPTHSNVPVTLATCFKDLNELDAQTKLSDEKDIYHRVPFWNDMQYHCMKHTSEGQTAFDNVDCPNCDKKELDLKKVYCQDCQTILPRPILFKNDQPRVIKAFKTSYRRMRSDRPANALTTNSGVISSDVKGHPTENRVLSLREIMIISSVTPYSSSKKRFVYEFGQDDKLIRTVLGECIPPLLTYQLGCKINSLIL